MLKYLYCLFFTISLAQISDYSYFDAEACAMAGAIVAEKGNNWSIFYNPAGLPEINKNHFFAGGGKLYGYNWLNTYYLNGLISLPVIGKTGFSIKQLETKYHETILSTEQNISIAQGIYLQNDKNSHLSIGYTFNYIIWKLGKSAGISGDGSDGLFINDLSTSTIDLGILASLRNKYRFGLLLKNIFSGSIGQGMSRQILPRRINIGITYIPVKGLSTSLVSEYLLGKENLQTKGAIRYNLNSMLVIYAGAQSNPNRLGIGTTLSIKNQSFSYGIITHPILPLTHKFKFGIYL